MDNENKGKLHLLNPANKASFHLFHRNVLRDYSAFMRDAIKSNCEVAVNFLSWLSQYLGMVRNERNFNPSYLPHYQRGQVMLLNLGFRIGYELRGPHYGIVRIPTTEKRMV